VVDIPKKDQVMVGVVDEETFALCDGDQAVVSREKC
jgi:hypothetical protein